MVSKELKVCIITCLDSINRQKGTKLRLGDIQKSYMGKALGILDDKTGGGFDVHINHRKLQKMYERNQLNAHKILLKEIWEEYKKYKADRQRIEAAKIEIKKLMKEAADQQANLVDAQEKLNDLETILTTMSQTVYKD